MPGREHGHIRQDTGKAMSGKTSRMVRKELNRLARKENEIAESLVRELLDAPLKFRLLFAIRIVFRKRKKCGSKNRHNGGNRNGGMEP